MGNHWKPLEITRNHKKTLEITRNHKKSQKSRNQEISLFPLERASKTAQTTYVLIKDFEDLGNCEKVFEKSFFLKITSFREKSL